MKILIRSILFLFMLVFLNGFSADAQAPKYKLYITNQIQISSKIYQFDVYLLSTGPIPLELAAIQFAIGYDTSIANGGTISVSSIQNSTQLVAASDPYVAQPGNNSAPVTVNGVVYKYLSQAGRSGPGSGNGTIISTVKTGCTSPGTRIATYRITNSVDFRINSRCQHVFSTSAAAGRANTNVYAYYPNPSTGVIQNQTLVADTVFNFNTPNTCDQNITLNTPHTLTIKAFLEGYYMGNSMMTSSLYDLGLSTNSTATDSVTVNLWKTDNLNNTIPDYTFKTMLSNSGIANVVLSSLMAGKSYYISIKHRNSLEVWSANPVFINGSVSYDFTTGSDKAYPDITNPPLKNMGGGVYALYAGDSNQDGVVDILDYQSGDNDAFNFAFGYNATDCNGDGASDALDLQLIENNANLFLYYGRPR